MIALGLLMLGSLAAGLAALLERRVRGIAEGATDRPSRQESLLPSAIPVEMARTRITANGLVWLSTDGRVMTRTDPQRLEAK